MEVEPGARVIAVALALATHRVALRLGARPVKLVVPYAPGGPNDIIARLLAQKLAEALGGNFYVENTPGGGSTIGTGAASNAPADGHTLLVANQDIIVQPIIKARVPYDPVKSFAPLSMLVTAPETITVHPSVPAKDVKELIALAKANPGKYSYASPGYGTTPHLAMTWLFQLENSAEITHVPFQGAAPAMQSVLGGQTPIFHMVLPVVAPHIRSARSARWRWRRQAHGVLPGHSDHWGGRLRGPRGRLLDGRLCGRRDTQAGVGRVAVSDREDHGAARHQRADCDHGFDPTFSTPDELAAHMRAETDKWSKVVRQANIKID